MGDSVACYGLHVACEALRQRGHRVEPYDNSSSTPILLSVYWPEQVYELAKWSMGAARSKRVKIAGGNVATSNPAALLPFVDAVFCGDGECWDGEISGQSVATKDGPEAVKALAEKIIPLRYEDVQQNRRTFIEIARGCRNKCLFCQYGWLKPYREADVLDIKNLLQFSKTKSVRMFAADRFQHSKYEAIRTITDRKGLCDTGSDVSIRFLLKHSEYLAYTNKVRVGIEGMSARLRHMVGKRYTDDDVVEFCRLVMAAGIKSLDFYMIYGLPGEVEEDVKQFVDLLRKIDSIAPSGYALAIHWNAFTPSAQTPFQWAAPAYQYPAWLETHVFGVHGKNLKIMHKPRRTGDLTIIRRAIAIRAGQKTRKLVYAMGITPSKFKDPGMLAKLYERETGDSVVEQWPTSKTLPWDGVVSYKREAMLKLWQRTRQNTYGN